MNIINKIELPFEGGYYILTKEAVAVIKKASYFHLNFETKNGRRVKNQCWLRMGNKVFIRGINKKAELHYQMPINLFFNEDKLDWSISYKKYTQEEDGIKDPLQALAKKDAYIRFIPIDDIGRRELAKIGFVEDLIFWQLHFKRKIIESVFAKEVNHISKALIKKIDRNTKG